jgi:hypothetical protein
LCIHVRPERPSVLDSQGRLVISGTGNGGAGFVARFAIVD